MMKNSKLGRILVLLACAVLTTAADSFTLLQLSPRDGQLPYCCVVSLALFFGLRGTYLKRRALRITCKTAASAQEPYLVTLDPSRWNGQASYTKHPGMPHGFGRKDVTTRIGTHRSSVSARREAQFFVNHMV